MSFGQFYTKSGRGEVEALLGDVVLRVLLVAEHDLFGRLRNRKVRVVRPLTLPMNVFAVVERRLYLVARKVSRSNDPACGLLLLLLLLLGTLRLRLWLLFFAVTRVLIVAAKQLVQGGMFGLRRLGRRNVGLGGNDDGGGGCLRDERFQGSRLFGFVRWRGMGGDGYDELVSGGHVGPTELCVFLLALALIRNHGQGELHVLDACRERGGRIDFGDHALVGELLLELLHVDGERARQLHLLAKRAHQRCYPGVCASRERIRAKPNKRRTGVVRDDLVRLTQPVERLVEFLRFEALVPLDVLDRVVDQDVDLDDLLLYLRDQDVVGDGDRQLHGVRSSAWRVRLDWVKEKNNEAVSYIMGTSF